jgi:hypothetical protein
MSFLNYPSSVVRKASATVQSTINAASGRRGSHADTQVLTDADILANAKEKLTLHIKVPHLFIHSFLFVLSSCCDC